MKNQTNINKSAPSPSANSLPVSGSGHQSTNPIIHQSVLAPQVEPWPEPVDGKLLLDALAAILRRFVVLPKWAAEALSLWIVHTYAFLLRDVSTYIGIESPEK